MYINNKISDSISFYVNDSSESQTIKILTSPIDYLKGLKISGYFFILNNFITDEVILEKYINIVKDIMIQGYYNYYKKSIFNNKLYRSISISELKCIRENLRINDIYSTTKTFNSCADYTIEVSNSEWDPKEHFIIELNLKDNLPYIDVDIDSSSYIEPNEVILLSGFNINNLKLIHDVKPNILGFYSHDTIPIYSADIYGINNNMDLTKLEEKYNFVVSNIDTYGCMIQDYLQDKINDNIFSDPNYLCWANSMIEYINILDGCIKKFISDNKELDDLKVKIKSL